MKPILLSLVIVFSLLSCKNETALPSKNETVLSIKKEAKIEEPLPLSKKVFPLSKPIKLVKSEAFINKLFVDEFSNLSLKKYKCRPQPNGIIYGDINGDKNVDVLVRYSVNDDEQQSWVASGWLIIFSNDKKELDKFIFFDWSSGHGARNDFDLGFPESIINGEIKSTIDVYAEDDANCCPSIKREITYSLDNELYTLDSHFVDTKEVSNGE
jgi:hypothetical protein